MMLIEPGAIKFGQTPESQFPPKRFLGGEQGGNWDRQVIPVESHLLYRSYVQHFIQGETWENTPFYAFALETIEQGRPFRGEYATPEALQQRFEKCDQLYAVMAQEGYKSNHQLFSEGKLDNILELMDEVTVNLGRDGGVILNDGWHRFTTARLLKIPQIPVRICARHAQLTRL
ncbi:MAG: hypothetical protein P8045_07710 [Candidatus Thiodiazotropha sp.]|jgi:hypothetical protein